MSPVQRFSNAADYRYNSDGNSSSYSSAEDNHRLERQRIPSFMMNDDIGGRSYVDPWDMENYSFLRKQLEGISLSDNEFSPAFETNSNELYYVPLDNNGSPQYQYKHYFDFSPYRDEVLPQSFTDNEHDLMANIDEYDFYNEYFDSNLSYVHNDDSYLEFSNPSRQSERSRFNNQDYHTYIPPSIIKDIPSLYVPNQIKLRRRASVSFRPDVNINHPIEKNVFSSRHVIFSRQNENSATHRECEKTNNDVRLKLNRRKSFHDLSNNPELSFRKLERRKSVLDHPHVELKRNLKEEILPEHEIKEKFNRRASTTEFSRRPQKNVKGGILNNSQNKSNKSSLNVSFNSKTKFESLPPKSHINATTQSNSSLVYIYETAGRKRKMFLPNNSTRLFDEEEFRYSHPDIPDAFSLDPIEQYLNRPTSRYTMTNYGHLKIDYSCSWNYLDKCIAQRVCL